MALQQIKLDNGLEIVAEPMETSRSMAVGFFVRTGARDETPEVSGVSHFLEHMLFKGTQKRTAWQVNRELDDMGGYSNAFTGEEMTVYYAAVLPELQTGIVELLADLMRPALRDDDFKTEKQVILEEIHMYEDQPPFGVDEKCRELFFADHPLGKSVLGSVQSVSDLSVDQMRDYFERGYSANHIVVAACGKFDFNRLVDDLKRLTESWQPANSEREIWTPQGRQGKFIFEKESSTQEYVFQLVSGPNIASPERYASILLANIVGDDVGSRFFWELVDNGKADTASLSYNEYLDAGNFTRVLCSSPESVRDNLAVMSDICQQVQMNGVTEEELERAKNKLMSRVLLGSELPRGRLFSVGSEWLQTGKYSSIQNDMDIVKSIELEHINAVLKKYPITDPLTVAIGPMKPDAF